MNAVSDNKLPVSFEMQMQKRKEMMLKRFSSNKTIVEKNKIRYTNSFNPKLKYITYGSSFNIPFKGILCDWHSSGMIHKNKYFIHPSNVIGAEEIFGDYGLFDCSEYFRKNNRNIRKLTGTTLCANPIRAILDILFYEIHILNQYPKKLNNFFTDYMFDEIDINELKLQIDKLRNKFSREQQIILNTWLTKEINIGI